MAKSVATNNYLKVGTVDLSDHVRTMQVNMSSDDVDLTSMGAVSHQHAPGLRDDRISGTMFQDYASGSVDPTLVALQGSATGATIVAAYNGSTISSTNPSYTMVGVLLNYNPIDDEVGSANIVPFEFVPAAGSFITRATA
jgi:predicted phosphoribosyltransferase